MRVYPQNVNTKSSSHFCASLLYGVASEDDQSNEKPSSLNNPWLLAKKDIAYDYYHVIIQKDTNLLV